MSTTSTDVVGMDTPTTRSNYIVWISKKNGNYILAPHPDYYGGHNVLLVRKRFRGWEKLEPQARGVFL